MEILRKGTPKKDVLWIGQCRDCSAIARAKREELGTTEPGDYRSDGEAWTWATCPVCHAKKSMCFHEVTSESGRRLRAELMDNGGAT